MTSPRLGYVVRFVTDLDASVRFYQGVLGQRLTKRGGHWAQFDCGSVTFGLYERAAMAVALAVPESALGSAPGAGELAFEVADCDAAFSAAVAAGARPFKEPQDRSWGERTGYLLDPDGAFVELYMRVQRTATAAEDTDDGAESGETVRRNHLATPSSLLGPHGDPSD